jgi:hypothetical protein
MFETGLETQTRSNFQGEGVRPTTFDAQHRTLVDAPE